MPTPSATPIFPRLAASTDAPPPPVPSPTPTPFVYIVQSGDTLIGIAVRHNVSLEAIEAANPGIDPGNLQPGQQVLIPPPAEEGAPSVAVVSTPLPVSVPPFACGPTPVGSLICYGELVNSTADPIANLVVRVTLVNADNTLGDSEFVYAPLDVIPAGAAVPLAAVFASAEGRAAVASVVRADQGGALAERFVSLAVDNLQAAPAPAGFSISGALVNPTAAELRGVVAVATVYNSAGSVAGYRKITFGDRLAANGVLPFSIALPGVTEAAKWAVAAQGRKP